MTTKRAFAPAAASHETGGIVSIDEWPVLPDVADKDALLQTLLDRDKYALDATAAVASDVSDLQDDVEAIQGGTESLRPAYDAHHIHAWRCITTDGSKVVADVGAVDLTGGGTHLACDTGPIYRGSASLVNVNAAEENRTLSATVSIDTSTTSYTIEAVVYVSQLLPYGSGWGTYPVALGLVSAAPVDGHQLRWFNGGTPGALVSTAWVAGGGANETSYTVGSDYGEVSQGPHHFMISWDKATATSSIYIDGKLVKTGASEALTSTLVDFHVSVPSQGGSVADVRISDIARDQAYALAATRALRRM